MPEETAAATSTSGGGGQSGTSHLPWHLVPSFKPGETCVNEYTRRLEFLANVWPLEHLSQLAPRACLLCEGTAFQKVVRLDPLKLKVQSLDGIKLVVQTLGECGDNLRPNISTSDLNELSLGQSRKVMKHIHHTLPVTKCNMKIFWGWVRRWKR